MRRIAMLIAAAMLLLSSCMTTISVPYMQPSSIDMGGYRNLAVASVVPYRGFVPPSRWVASLDIHSAHVRIHPGYSRTTAASVASYATEQLYGTLSSSGFFSLLPPEATDAVLELGSYGFDISAELKRMGFDAVLIPRITNMSVSETIYSEPHNEWWTDESGEVHRRVEFDYFYTQTASIEYRLTVIDTSTGAIVAQRTFADRETREGALSSTWSSLDDASYLFRRMIRSFNDGILRQFVPTYREYDVTLMKNKPKLEAVEGAYDAAADGDSALALDIFSKAWEGDSHLPSGYNAALLLAASGRFEESMALLEDVMAAYSSEDARRLYRDLQSIEARNAQAMSQVTGEGSAVSVDRIDGNAIYDMVLRK